MVAAITLMAIAALSAAPAGDVQANAAWAERLFADNVQQTQPGRLAVLYEDGLGDTKLGRCTAGGALRLGDKTYEHGIGVNAKSTIRVMLPQPGKVFRAVIGVDRNMDGQPASVQFMVLCHSRVLYGTEVMRATDPPRAIEVPLEGTRVFDLVVDNGADTRAFDQADWADALVELEDGTQVRLEDLAQNGDPGVAWPFSFRYGRLPSHMALAEWERRVQIKAVDGGQCRTIIFTDPYTKLEVRADATVYTGTPGVDWTICFTNKGNADTPVIEEVCALDALFQCGPQESVTFHSLRSTGGVDDWLPFEQPVAAGQRHEFAPANGRSSLGACPFFDVQWKGGGVVAGIGWTGQWSAAVENRDGTIALQAGMQNLRTVLHPGESIRTPRILLMQWTGDDHARAYNLWRQTMLRHILPRVRGEVVVPPIAYLSTAFYEMDRCTEAIALDHFNAGKDLGFEVFWYDAYYGKDDFPTVGNYVLPVQRGFNSTRFPNGLKPIADAVHAAGLQFLVWFEPERICPGTLMATEHPEWVVLPDKGPWGMFNLAVPEARQYITDYINGLIDDYGLSWVRIDNAVQYTPLWAKLDAAAAGPDRVGIAEVRYVEGLYQWWDDMRGKHPDLAIDDCASGGCRIDLELCSRSIPLWRSDATITPLLNKDLHQAAMQNQVMTAGLSRYVPFNVTGQMGADPYNFRSGFNGGISFCEDTRPESYPRELLKAAIAEGKRIRKYYFGNLYALTDITTSPKDWCVLQYHRPDARDGMVVAFRRPQSPFTGFQCALNEVEPEANYEVTLSPGYSPTPSQTMKGAELRNKVLEIDEAPGSTLLEYRLLNK